MAEESDKPTSTVQEEDKLSKQIEERAEKNLKQAQLIADAERETLKIKKQSAEWDEKSIDAHSTIVELTNAEIDLTEKQIQLQKIKGKANTDEYKELLKKLKDLREQRDLLKEESQIFERKKESLKIVNNLTKDTLQQTQQIVFANLELTRLFTNIQAQLLQGKGIFGVWKAILAENVLNAAQLFITIADGNSQFAATTGQIADRTMTFGMGMAKYGVGFEKLNKASMELFTNMSNFSELDKSTQAELSKSAALMSNLGVSASITGRNYDILTKALKMSSDQARRTNEDLAKAAIGAGIAPSKMLEGFASTMPKLAAYGKQAIDVYVDLQKQAKSLGMEVSTLTGIIGDQFDTFEGSARAAGKLNAILGGNYLNSIEMLNATESERVLLLKQSFDMSGRNFDSLSKYEKKAIAASIGISDLNEASKLFGSSTTQLTMDMEKQAAEQERLEKIQQEAAKVTDKLKEAFSQLMIVVKPIVDVFVNVVNVVATMMDQFKGWGGIIWLTAGAYFYFGGIVGISAAAVKMFGLAAGTSMFSIAGLRQILSTPMGKFGMLTAILLLVAAFEQFHDILFVPHSPILWFALLMLPFIIMAIGNAADASKVGLEALGLAVLMIGAGVGAAAWGLSMLVKSFKDLSGAEMAGALLAITIVIGGFIIGILLLADVAVVASEPLLLLGLAFLMLGGGIALAGLGLKMIVSSLKEATDPKIASGALYLAAGLLALVIPLGLLSMISVPLLILGAAFMLLGVGMTLGATAANMLAIALPKLAAIDYSGINQMAVGLLLLSIPLLILAALSKPILILAAGFLIFGIAANIASSSIEKFSTGFEKLTNDKVISGIYKLPAAFLSLIPSIFALSFFSDTILDIGYGFYLMGAGVTMLATGLSVVRPLLNGFAELLAPLPNIINQLSLSIGLLGIALASIFAIGLGGLSGIGIGVFIAGLFMISSAIYTIGKAMESIPEGKAASLDAIQKTLVAASSITNENVKPTKEFITAIKEYYIAQSDSKEADKDALVAALKEVFKAQTETAAKEKPIQLVIRGDDMAKALKQGDQLVAGKLLMGVGQSR